MFNAELIRCKGSFSNEAGGWFTVRHVEFVDEVGFGAFGNDAFFIEHVYDTQLAFDQVEHVAIIHKCDIVQVDPLRSVLILDRRKEIMSELLLQNFISVVDTYLLKIINLKALKTKNVQ